MKQQTLYQECPLCMEAPVVLKKKGLFGCQQCALTLQERAVLGLVNRGRYGITELGPRDYRLAEAGLNSITFRPEALKIVIGNIYRDQQLADIARGNIEIIRPVMTILAGIILEQLNEECVINVNNVRRGHGQPLAGESWYYPRQKIPHKAIEWHDEGNLFCTSQRIVMPSGRFTFIRLDRKVVAVQAYADGVAIQRKSEAFATYFAGCFGHESALVAAYVMAKVPVLRPSELNENSNE